MKNAKGNKAEEKQLEHHETNARKTRTKDERSRTSSQTHEPQNWYQTSDIVPGK